MALQTTLVWQATVSATIVRLVVHQLSRAISFRESTSSTTSTDQSYRVEGRLSTRPGSFHLLDHRSNSSTRSAFSFIHRLDRRVACSTLKRPRLRSRRSSEAHLATSTT